MMVSFSKPFKIKYLSKDRILESIQKTNSLTKASELLNVSFPTFRKYAKRYKDKDGISLFEKYKNQGGKGINKRKRFRRDKNGNLIHITEDIIL